MRRAQGDPGQPDSNVMMERTSKDVEKRLAWIILGLDQRHRSRGRGHGIDLRGISEADPATLTAEHLATEIRDQILHWRGEQLGGVRGASDHDRAAISRAIGLRLDGTIDPSPLDDPGS